TSADVNGNYSFSASSLSPFAGGQVTIGILRPNGYAASLPASGHQTVGAPGASDVTGVDFAMSALPVSASGRVFRDVPGTGVWVSTDPAMANWTVFCDLNGNAALDTGEPSAVTNSTGVYTLNGV